MSTEGVKLSGAGFSGATVNGSTLWRHPDHFRGPKVQHTFVYESLRQADGEDISAKEYFPLKEKYSHISHGHSICI